MAGYFIAVLLCLGDNCDLVRVEPGTDYPNYESCSAAMGRSAARIGDVTSRLQKEENRQGDIVCLRDRTTVVDVDEEYEALAATIVRERPEATAPPAGTIERGRRVRATGAIASGSWLRVALPGGRSGYVYGERLRKLGPGGTAAPAQGAAANPAASVSPPSADERRAAATPPNPSAPPSAPPAAAVRSRQEFRDCDRCPTMIALPGGAFQMGSGADSTERPAHRVAVASFAIGKFEVTQAEWAACATEGACSYAPPPVAGDDRLPMSNLSWDDAVEYAQWLARSTGRPYRLPSEAEWEFAARAGTTTPYPWGARIGVAKANCGGCGGAYEPARPAAVGSFPANPWGLHDMLGGVAEWVQDCWHKSYDGAPRDGSAWETPRCGQRVVRGGSWRNPPDELTVSARIFYDAPVRYTAHGMRIALSLNGNR